MRIVRIAATLLVACAVSRAEAQGTVGPPPRRAALEQQLRERVADITRKRLNLDDAQMAKLQDVNSRYAPQIVSLAAQERDTRQQLRKQLVVPSPDQNEVATLLDTVLRLQRQRVSLLESEQKDLSAFLTPVQRAKYMGLQSQIRRRAEQLRAPNGSRPGGRAGNRPPR
jgi:periplasmic protein CpxP/Spy